MRVRMGLYSTFAVFALSSCSFFSKTAEKYVQEMQTDAVYNQQQSTENYVVLCSYRPTTYVALKELAGTDVFKKNTEQFKQALSAKVAEFKNASYFDLSIFPKDGVPMLNEAADQQTYALLVNELNYQLSEDMLILTDQGDSIRPLNYTFLNSYGLKPSVDLSIVVANGPLINCKNYFEFIYTDRLWGIGEKRFRFDAAVIQQESPSISLN